MDLSGKVAIVTGSGSGIGRATAILLAQRKAKVAVCGRRLTALEETTTLIRSFGGEAIAVEVDVRNQLDITGLVDRVTSNFGSINILVNNAGVAVAKPFLEHEEADWDLMIDTNLKSIFLTCKAIIPELLKADHGVIVNVSSILGKAGIANFSAYSASKFGIIGLTQSIAKEYDPSQISIYTVCPGRTFTDMQTQLGGDFIASLSMPSEKVAQKIVKIITGKVRLQSGKDIVIDKQSLRLRRHELTQKLRRKTYNLKAFVSSLRELLTTKKP